MTCKEKLMAYHPEWGEEKIDEVLAFECPHAHMDVDIPVYCSSNDECYPEQCWDRELPTNEVKKAPITLNEILSEPELSIKDSGDRTQFETGAVRDMREGKGRCDLMPLEVVRELMHDEIIGYISNFMHDRDTADLYCCLDSFSHNYENGYTTMLLEVSKHYEEGAKKYGDSNWQKGIPVWCYIDSAIRHYLKWKRGDKDEPHDRAFVWNLMCCIWEVDHSTRTAGA